MPAISEIARVKLQTAVNYPDLSRTERQSRREELLLDHINSRPYGARMKLTELGYAMNVLSKDEDSLYKTTFGILQRAIKRGVVYKEKLYPGFTLHAAAPVTTQPITKPDFVYNPGKFFNRALKNDTALLRFLNNEVWEGRLSRFKQLPEFKKYSIGGLSRYMSWSEERGLIRVKTTERGYRRITPLVTLADIGVKDTKLSTQEKLPMPEPQTAEPAKTWPDEAPIITPSYIDWFESKAIDYAWLHPESTVQLRLFINHLKGEQNAE